jgi:hypothetical protein
MISKNIACVLQQVKGYQQQKNSLLVVSTSIYFLDSFFSIPNADAQINGGWLFRMTWLK